MISLFSLEPTRIELSPKRTELTVGESIVLSCKAIHDPTLDVIFRWTLNGQPIDFEREGGHFESIRAVSVAQHPILFGEKKPLQNAVCYASIFTGKKREEILPQQVTHSS